MLQLARSGKRYWGAFIQRLKALGLPRPRQLGIPKEIVEQFGRPKLFASYRAQIARAMKNPEIYWQLERMRDGRMNFENTPPIIRKEAGKALDQVASATVNGMWQVKKAEDAQKEPVAPIVEDKKATVAGLGNNLAVQRKREYWVPKLARKAVAALKRL